MQTINTCILLTISVFCVFQETLNTTHATSDMNWADERLGKERLQHAYAYRDLLEQNGWLCNGSDFPVENIDPLDESL